MPFAFIRGRRRAEVEDQPHRAIGQHALAHLVAFRNGFAIQQDVRDMRPQRGPHRDRAQRSGGHA
jgi:hypothetical protein